jgi:hypothetical protein
LRLSFALGLQWAAERRKQLCLSQPFRQREESRAYGDWLAAVPSSKRGDLRALRAEESELTYALQENG